MLNSLSSSEKDKKYVWVILVNTAIAPRSLKQHATPSPMQSCDIKKW